MKGRRVSEAQRQAAPRDRAGVLEPVQVNVTGGTTAAAAAAAAAPVSGKVWGMPADKGAIGEDCGVGH